MVYTAYSNCAILPSLIFKMTPKPILKFYATDKPLALPQSTSDQDTPVGLSLPFQLPPPPSHQLLDQLAKLKRLQLGLVQQFSSAAEGSSSSTPQPPQPTNLRARTQPPETDDPSSDSSANKTKDRFARKQEQARNLTVKLNELRTVMHEITATARDLHTHPKDDKDSSTTSDSSKQLTPALSASHLFVPRPSVSFNRGNPLELPNTQHFRQPSSHTLTPIIQTSALNTPSTLSTPSSGTRDPLIATIFPK